MGSSIEWVKFKLNQGVSESDFLSLQDQVNDWVKTQPGFYYRTLLKDTNGIWNDIVHWESIEQAKQAAETFGAQDFCGSMMAMIDKEDLTMSHVPALSEVGYDAGS